MADALQMAGLAITGGVLILFLRERTPTIGFCLSVVLVTVLLLQASPKLTLVIEGVRQMFATNNQLFMLLLRGIGISYVTEFTARLLSGAGEEGAAKAVVMAGNVGLAFLALEPAANILRAAEALLS